jgi:hypothetical protein
MMVSIGVGMNFADNDGVQVRENNVGANRKQHSEEMPAGSMKKRKTGRLYMNRACLQ